MFQLFNSNRKMYEELSEYLFSFLIVIQHILLNFDFRSEYSVDISSIIKLY